MAIKSGIQKAKVTRTNLPDTTIHIVGNITSFSGSPNMIFTSPRHGLENGNRVYLTTTGTLPPYINTETEYFVINKTDNTFNLSLVNPLTEDYVPYIILNNGTESSGVHQIIRIGYYARYRIISEDRNRFSHWSPVYFVEDPNALESIFVTLDGGDGI